MKNRCGGYYFMASKFFFQFSLSGSPLLRASLVWHMAYYLQVETFFFSNHSGRPLFGANDLDVGVVGYQQGQKALIPRTEKT